MHFTMKVSFFPILFVNLANAVRLPGKCPNPPDSTNVSILTGGLFSLKLLVPLDNSSVDNVFTERWDMQSPTCDILSTVKAKGNSYEVLLAKFNTLNCGSIVGKLFTVNGENNYLMKYSIVGSRNSSVGQGCLKHLKFHREISYWVKNGSFHILWTCDNLWFSNAHDEGVLIFAKLKSKWDSGDVLKQWLNFSQIGIDDFQQKNHSKCDRPTSCMEYQCSYFLLLFKGSGFIILGVIFLLTILFLIWLRKSICLALQKRKWKNNRRRFITVTAL